MKTDDHFEILKSLHNKMHVAVENTKWSQPDIRNTTLPCREKSEKLRKIGNSKKREGKWRHL